LQGINQTHFRTIKAPAITKALPVAQDGIDAKIGEKKTQMKNMKPITMPVIPVLPPSVAISGRGPQIKIRRAYH
jgi:hypothetical protein